MGHALQDKYRAFHPRLPLIVAQTLLSADSQIELPLWLVRHFKVNFCIYFLQQFSDAVS